MTETIWVGVLSLIGTLVGSIAGILASNKLTSYRIEQLEKTVSKHNKLTERMLMVEESAKSAHSRIDQIEEEIKQH